MLLVRLCGGLIIIVSAAGSVYAIEKLYTGRGGDTPLRSALLEQPLMAFLGFVGVVVGLVLAVWASPLVERGASVEPSQRRRTSFLLFAGVLILCVAILELGSRGLYAIQYDFPYWHTTEQLIYPPLHEQFHDYSGDGTNVLLLGGSVLYYVGRKHKLEEAFDDCRVYNLAQTAHSSLDSLIKYRYALGQGYRFDYVIFYHGINEVRANNAPPELFSLDYNHYFFYRMTNAVFGDRSPLLGAALHSSLMFRTYRLYMQLAQTRMFGRRYVHTAYPKEDWLQYGGTIRSAEVFERNLLRVVELAETHDAEVIVPSFAYHPALDATLGDGTTEMSRSKLIQFTEQWGLPEHVAAGIREHNAVIVSLQGRFNYVDTRDLRKAESFLDPCHFAPEAEAEFIGLLLEALRSTQAGQ